MNELEKYEYVKQFVTYDPETGVFVWNYNSVKGRKTKGVIATKSNGRNNQIQKNAGTGRHDVKKITVIARRLAWFIQTGELPSGPITTVNGNSHDDRFRNLQVGMSPNHKRKASSSRKKEGGTGVCWNTKFASWIGHVKNKGTRIQKRFDTKLDAEVWVIEKRNELGFDGQLHGRVEK